MCDAGHVTALMGIATRLRLARLFVIIPDRAPQLGELIAASFAGGADIVGLLEEPDASIPDDSATAGIQEIREAARQTQGLVAYLGPPIRASLLSTDVLVLPDASVSASRVRSRLHPWTQIGRQCTDRNEVDAALGDPGLDFLLVGPGLDNVRHAAARAPQHDPASKPWFAVGGVTPASVAAVTRAGARRVAVGRAITQAADPRAVALHLKDGLRGAWNADPRMEDVTRAAFGTSTT